MSGNSNNLRVLISGGGTGGHIFPALSIANEIKRRLPQAKILFVGAEGRMEMERVPAAGYEIKGLPVMGFDRKRPWRNVKVLYQLKKSMNMARVILDQFQPNVAVGVGGYASAPMLKECQKRDIPTLLQEQNSFAGVANKLLAKKARLICVAYEGMERYFPADKIVLTGNPVRRSLLDCTSSVEDARKSFDLDPNKRTVLIVGGSLGARTINDSIIAGLRTIGKHDDVQLIWQSGKIYDERCREALVSSKVTNIKQMPFISNMDLAYRAADLVISRAGASSISELQLLGKASLLVPSPNVAEDHQTKNAMALVNRNAALMIPDSEAGFKLVDVMLATIEEEGVLKMLGENVSKMALHDAAEVIVDKVIQIAR